MALTRQRFRQKQRSKSKKTQKKRKQQSKKQYHRKRGGFNGNGMNTKYVNVPGMGSMTEKEYKNKMNSLNPIGFDD